MGIKRSTFFDFTSSKKACFSYQPLRKRVSRYPGEDKKIADWVRRKRQKEIFFDTSGGYRVLCRYAKADSNLKVRSVNHKRMYSICKENHLLFHRKQKRRRVGYRVYENRVVTGPHQLWQFDIKYGHILLHGGKYQFFFLCVFIDVFTRDIVAYHIGLRCLSEDILRTLKIALIEHQINPGHNLVIRSDNGPQMTSRRLTEGIKTLPVVHEFIPPKCPNKNAYIESFFSIVSANVTSPRTFLNFRSAHRTMVDFIEFYRKKKIHGALNMTIEEFKKRLPQLNLADYELRL